MYIVLNMIFKYAIKIKVFKYNPMKKIVLMRLMGHSSFQTTQKYYIRVSAKRKRLAMQEAYNVVFYERKAS